MGIDAQQDSGRAADELIPTLGEDWLVSIDEQVRDSRRTLHRACDMADGGARRAPVRGALWKLMPDNCCATSGIPATFTLTISNPYFAKGLDSGPVRRYYSYTVLAKQQPKIE